VIPTRNSGKRGYEMIQTDNPSVVDKYDRLSHRFINYIVEREALCRYLNRSRCTRRGAREYRFKVLNTELLPKIQRQLANFEEKIVTL